MNIVITLRLVTIIFQHLVDNSGTYLAITGEVEV